jgi:hypothetical protein
MTLGLDELRSIRKFVAAEAIQPHLFSSCLNAPGSAGTRPITPLSVNELDIGKHIAVTGDLFGGLSITSTVCAFPVQMSFKDSSTLRDYT